MSEELKRKFCVLVSEVRDYHKIVSNLEDAFDGIVLINLYSLPQTVLNELEKETNRIWGDTIWENIFNPEYSINNLWEDIIKLPEIEN